MCFVILGYSNDTEMNGLMFPLAFVFILSYCVVSLFSEIFGMCIDTLMICYISDEEMFPPAERFCDGSLRNAMQKTQQSAEAPKVEIRPKVLS